MKQQKRIEYNRNYYQMHKEAILDNFFWEDVKVKLLLGYTSPAGIMCTLNMWLLLRVAW